MQRKYQHENKSNSGSFGGIVVVGFVGIIALVMWLISIGNAVVADQETHPDITTEFSGKIISATETGSDYVEHSFLAYSLLQDEWVTSYSYYEKETWTFSLELANGTVIQCTKVFLADTVNIAWYYSDVDGSIPINMQAKLTGSYAEDKVTFKVNEIIDLNTGQEFKMNAPTLPPGTVSAPAPAAA